MHMRQLMENNFIMAEEMARIMRNNPDERIREMKRDCCRFEPETEEVQMLNEAVLSRQEQDTKVYMFWIQCNIQSPAALDCCVDIKNFVLDGTAWCVQIYQNGLKTNESEGWISFIVMRTSAHAPKQNVLFTFWIRDNDGEVKHTIEQIWKRYDLELPIKLLPLSEACNDESKLLHENVIQVFCRLSVESTRIEPEECAEIPFNAPGEPIGYLFRKVKEPAVQDDVLQLPVSCPVTQAIQIPEISSSMYAEQCFTWIPPLIWEIPPVGSNVISPTFQFGGRTYRMRFYPNGRSKYEITHGISVMLERSRSPASTQVVACEIGIKLNDRGFLEQHYFRKHEDVLGPINLVPSGAWQLLIGVCVNVFCKMQSKIIEMEIVE